MTASEPQRARRLGEAIEAYLAHRAGGREPGDSLLDEQPTLREWLSPMLAAPPEAGDGADQGLDLLGDFRLVRECGRGGMGVVFEAVQVSLGRRVALKILAAERTGSPRSIERFRHEAKAAARLRHPSIVQVFGVGELDGRHVIAMEFVDGPNLAERLEQQRALPLAQRRIVADGDERSHVTQVAALVAELADALAYAHEQGVVHRDVKPHNVLLQRDGTPKLVDFGVAKQVDAISLSHTRELIGTPHYMSPEQAARGDSSDPRSDVFSLGVVLYELLTFTRPFDGATADHVLAAIRQHEPAPLRTRDARIPCELERICGKALEKSPAQRYASAAALAADLRSFLRHEPISIGPPSVLTRARKIARRHRWPLTIGAGAVLALATTVAVASEWRRVGVDAERVQTRRAERFAFDAVDELLELLAAELPRTPAAAVTSRDRIRAAVRLYEAYLADAGQQPALRSAVAGASRRIADVYRALGMVAEAAAAYARSVELLGSLLDENPSRDEAWLALADVHRARMVLAQQSLDADAARAAFEADLQAREQVLARSPGSIDALCGVAKTLTDRGRGLLHGAGTLVEARAALERADGAWSRVAASALAEDPALRLCVLQNRSGLAYAEQLAGRPAEARIAFEQVLAAVTADPAAASAEAVEWRVQIAECEYGLGLSCRLSGDPVAAELHLRRAIELQDELRRELPGRPDMRQRCISTRAMIGSLLLDGGDREGARRELRVAFEDARALLEESGRSVRSVRQFTSLSERIAATFLEQGAVPDEAAFEHLHAARSELEQALERGFDAAVIQSALGGTLSNLAAAHLLRGDVGEALELVDRAIRMQDAAIARDPDAVQARNFMRLHHLLRAQILLRQGDAEAALQAVETSIEWTVDPRSLGATAAVLEQCAKACVDPAVAKAVRERAREVRARAAAGGSR